MTGVVGCEFISHSVLPVEKFHQSGSCACVLSGGAVATEAELARLQGRLADLDTRCAALNSLTLSKTASTPDSRGCAKQGALGQGAQGAQREQEAQGQGQGEQGEQGQEEQGAQKQGQREQGEQGEQEQEAQGQGAGGQGQEVQGKGAQGLQGMQGQGEQAEGRGGTGGSGTRFGRPHASLCCRA